MTSSADELLDDLSSAQRLAVVSDAAPLCIIAGAGSGKTRVLTRRVAWRAATEQLDPRAALVLTFTRRAAIELRSRLHQLGLHDATAAGTFHSVAYAQLRTRWSERGLRPPTLLTHRRPVFARSLPGSNRTTVVDAMAELDWSRARLIEPDQYPAAAEAAGRVPPLPADRLVTAFAAFQQEKRRRRLVDFDDLLVLAARDLDADPTYAEARRWRFRHLFVDELQDVNPLQYQLLETWRGDRPDLCVVGDPDQAIYSWNGADATILQQFGETHPGAEVIRLDDNYRSTPQILDVAQRVLTGGDLTRPAWLAHAPDGPVPTIHRHADDRAEAAAVARTVRDSRAPGTRWSAQAVLVRTNAQTALFQEAFAAAGVPYRVRGGRAFLEHPTIGAAARQLRSSPGRLVDDMADLHELVGDDPTAPAAVDASEHLDILLRLAGEHLSVEATATSAEFVELLEAMVGGESIGPRRDAVELVTFHAAKGLEWPIVHLAGLEAGIVPSARVSRPDELAEERRLLFVAMTRARQQLTMHWAARRTFGERTSERRRSPYLDVIDGPDSTPSDETAATGPARPSIPPEVRAQRDRLGRDRPSDDDPLLVELRAWRDAAARRAGVAAHLVADDAALAEIARVRPTTLDDLSGLEGFGRLRASRFGDNVLSIVSSYV